MQSMLKGILLAAATLPLGTAVAADVQTRPNVDLRLEQNDNIDLNPGGSVDGDVLGYIANMELVFDIATPRGETSLQPRIKIQEYPDRDDFERIESFFDLRSRYKWERSDFDFDGYYSRQDTYNSDTPSGDDPGGNPDTGALVIGEVRTAVALKPTFEHRVTERTSIGITADYETARYDSDDVQTKTDYDFGELEAYLSWALSPASDLSLGGFASRYETRDNNEETDAIGWRFGYTHRWSERDGIEAALLYERDDTTQFLPVALEQTTSNWGGEVSAYRTFERSELRVTAGTTFVPTGDRGKSESNHFLMQYDRMLTERLSFKGAARYDSLSSLDDLGGGTNRDYARADLSLRWFISPTWYLGGGYSYIWEDRETSTSDAHNNKLFINFGYQALDRQSQLPVKGPETVVP